MHGPVLGGNMAVCKPKGLGGEGTGSVEGARGQWRGPGVSGGGTVSAEGTWGQWRGTQRTMGSVA